MGDKHECCMCKLRARGDVACEAPCERHMKESTLVDRFWRWKAPPPQPPPSLAEIIEELLA